MDDDTEELLEEYAEKISVLIRSLIKTPLIEDKDTGGFLIAIGTEFFKVGSAIKEGRDPRLLESHRAILIPKKYCNEVKAALTLIQNRVLKKQLDDELEKAKNIDEEAAITKRFMDYVKNAPLPYSCEKD